MPLPVRLLLVELEAWLLILLLLTVRLLPRMPVVILLVALSLLMLLRAWLIGLLRPTLRFRIPTLLLLLLLHSPGPRGRPLSPHHEVLCRLLHGPVAAGGIVTSSGVVLVRGAVRVILHGRHDLNGSGIRHGGGCLSGRHARASWKRPWRRS